LSADLLVVRVFLALMNPLCALRRIKLQIGGDSFTGDFVRAGFPDGGAVNVRLSRVYPGFVLTHPFHEKAAERGTHSSWTGQGWAPALVMDGLS